MAKKSPKKTAAAPAASPVQESVPIVPLVTVQKHTMHLHNVTKSAANWTLSGGGQKYRGVTPPFGESCVRVDHAKKYKINFWGKDKKKQQSANLGPDGSAIYNGRGIAVTHPH